ncbi:MAG: U32 family peptidase [Clostridia bacterium]|nr:U32 family peptidase [Clostridia bacterium]
MKKPELLAPAGSPEALRAAIHFGADAVYVGGPLLQLRAEAAGFSFDALAEGADYVHGRGKKLYVAVNCFATNAEIAAAPAYAKELRSVGADAVIVSDLGLIAAIRKAVPDLPVHVSTQANVLNYAAVNAFASMGCRRVVLGREMTLADIEALKGKIDPDVEIEAFVHGAMCMAYSGRCLLSSFLNNRSGNRGECTQPCRWEYYLVEKKRANMLIPVAEEDGATAILSSADLNCLPFLNRLADAGVSSFKIEGRMKSPYYVATVVNAYRRRIDGTAEVDVLERELDAASHRPYTSGFYFGEAKTDPNNDGRYRASCRFTGVVLGKTGEGTYLVEMRNAFALGDTLEVLSPRSIGLSFPVTSIRGESGEPKEKADLVQEKVEIACPHALEAGDILRKRL